MQTYLDEVDLSRLVGCKESCEEKTLAFETIINTGLDFVFPLKGPTSTKMHCASRSAKLVNLLSSTFFHYNQILRTYFNPPV